MNILSIQSHVAYGHVGNSAAVFALQRLGAEVWPVHTVQLSNHTGYAGWRGQTVEADAVRDIVCGIAERGMLGECDGVLSGYIGATDIGEAVIDAVRAVKRANPAARWCCDPVIGDAGRGVFVRDGVPEFIDQRMLPVADIVTPNRFELEYLAARSIGSTRELGAAIAALHARGPSVVLVTSASTDDTPESCIDVVVSEGNDRFRLRTPRLPVAVGGAGDLAAALFFLHYTRTRSAREAMEQAVSSVYGLLHRAAAARSREMPLVAGQDELVRPSHAFTAQKL
jgi:pyridoxine kinase